MAVFGAPGSSVDDREMRAQSCLCVEPVLSVLVTVIVVVGGDGLEPPTLSV